MKKSFFIFSVVLMLTACDNNVRHVIGLEKKIPDAFKVVSNPPLSIPPDFNLASPGSKRAPVPDIAEQTRAAVFSTANTSSTSTPLSEADRQLLIRSGTSDADPNIATILNNEQAERQQTSVRRGLIDILLTKISPEKETSDPSVHPSKERQRIEKNKKEGKSLTDGNVPVTSSHSGNLITLP